MRTADFEAVQLDENVAVWTKICRSTVYIKTGDQVFYANLAINEPMLAKTRPRFSLVQDMRFTKTPAGVHSVYPIYFHCFSTLSSSCSQVEMVR